MQDFFTGTGYTLIYYIIFASTALILRLTVCIPDEVFRKLLHSILLGSFPIYLFGFPTWQQSSGFCLLFAAAVYPILAQFERIQAYSKTMTERTSGELKRSLLVVFSMFAIVICICWGCLSDRFLALASVFAWGFGDAAAALIGKNWGKHKIPHTKKSYEGTCAMFAVSFLCVLTILILRGDMVWYGYPIAALLTAGVAAATELYTPGGHDTFTCPISAMLMLIPLLHLFGGRL